MLIYIPFDILKDLKAFRFSSIVFVPHVDSPLRIKCCIAIGPFTFVQNLCVGTQAPCMVCTLARSHNHRGETFSYR